jgi:hypothetical protein
MLNTNISELVNYTKHPINSKGYTSSCKEKLDSDGVLVLNNFLNSKSIQSILNEAIMQQQLAYYCTSYHNVFLKPFDESLPSDHPRNRHIESSKGCITDDQVSTSSPLRLLYNSIEFKDFLCYVLGEESLHKYDDNLSSINIHYASDGQELGWHFDNSSFSITLMIQDPEQGGMFEYIRDFRYNTNNKINYDSVDKLLEERIAPSVLDINPGSLVLFRGKNSIHRVTPVVGSRVRILSVLAYNSEPNIALSETARMTFYGRVN